MDTVEGKRDRETGQNLLVRFFLHLLLLSIVASATAKWLILEAITAGRLRFRLLWCTHVWCLCRCCYSVSTKSEFPILKHSAADDSRPRSTVRPWFNLEQSAFLLLLLFAHFAFTLLLKQLQTLCFPFPFASDFITLIISLKSATFFCLCDFCCLPFYYWIWWAVDLISCCCCFWCYCHCDVLVLNLAYWNSTNKRSTDQIKWANWKQQTLYSRLASNNCAAAAAEVQQYSPSQFNSSLQQHYYRCLMMKVTSAKQSLMEVK